MPLFHRTLRGVCLSLLLMAAWAQAPVCSAAQVVYGSDVPMVGDSQVEYYADAHGTLDPSQLLAAPVHYLRPLRARGINFGLNSFAYWLHLSVSSRSSVPTVAYLSIAQPTLDDVRLYVVENGTITQTVRAGDELPAREQLVPDGHPVNHHCSKA